MKVIRKDMGYDPADPKGSYELTVIGEISEIIRIAKSMRRAWERGNSDIEPYSIEKEIKEYHNYTQMRRRDVVCCGIIIARTEKEGKFFWIPSANDILCFICAS